MHFEILGGKPHDNGQHIVSFLCCFFCTLLLFQIITVQNFKFLGTSVFHDIVMSSFSTFFPYFAAFSKWPPFSEFWKLKIKLEMVPDMYAKVHKNRCCFFWQFVRRSSLIGRQKRAGKKWSRNNKWPILSGWWLNRN